MSLDILWKDGHGRENFQAYLPETEDLREVKMDIVISFLGTVQTRVKSEDWDGEGLAFVSWQLP